MVVNVPRMAQRTVVQLEYAPRRRSLAGISLRRWLTWAAIGMALILGARFAGTAWDHGRLIQAQRRCLEHRGVAGEVVMDNRAGLNVMNGDWKQFYTLFSPPGQSRNIATAFLGELQKTDAGPRLVAVEVFNSASHPRGVGRDTLFDITVIQPGSAWSRPRLLSESQWNATLPFTEDVYPFQCRAGQRDPGNPAHFTISLRDDGVEHIVDGYLRADDTVVLELREGK